VEKMPLEMQSMSKFNIELQCNGFFFWLIGLAEFGAFFMSYPPFFFLNFCDFLINIIQPLFKMGQSI
jgi:hypothetical protein